MNTNQQDQQVPIEYDEQSLSTMAVDSCNSQADDSLMTQMSFIKAKTQQLDLRRKKQISLKVHVNSSLKIMYSGLDKSSSGCNLLNNKKSISKIDKLNQELPSIFHENYTIVDYLASGWQAEVYKIKDKVSGQYFIAKISKTNDLEEELMLKQEFQILFNLQNKYFVQPIQIIKDEKYNNIILIEEYFEGQNLYDIISNDLLELKTEQISQIAQQLLEAVDYLHKKSCVHRDINLKNILYNAEQNQIKLIDFGVSRQLKSSEDFMCSPHGNPLFKSPEITQEWTVYTEKVDEFGVGLAILSLLQKKIIKSRNVKKYIEQQQLLMSQSAKMNSEEIQNKNQFEIFLLTKKLLKKDFNKRISAEQALKLMIHA